MTIEVVDQDGTVIEFPDGTPHAQIAAVMRQRDAQRAAVRPAEPAGPPQPNNAQLQEAGRGAARRIQERQGAPFGLGMLTTPILNTIRDPARRENVGRSFRGAVDAAREIPNLDVERLASDTGQAVQQGVQNLPQTAGNIFRHIPQIARAATYGPFVDEENDQRSLDLARIMGDQQGVEQAASEANTNTAMAGLNVAAPLLFGARPSVLRAGATAAAIDAPFALSRGEGSLQERLPGALTEIGGVGAFGAGLQGTLNAIPRMAPSRANQRAADFENAGVRPSLAATQQGAAAGATKMIGENFLAGGGVRARLQASLDDTSRAAQRLANEAGEVAPREVVGEGIQRAARRFAQDRNAPMPAGYSDPRTVPVAEWSVPAKAEALYDNVFSRLARDEEAMVGAVEGNILSLDATRATLAQIENRVHGPASRATMSNPRLREIQTSLESDVALGELRFRDLREWRSWVRRAQKDEGLRQGLNNADLQRLEGALTQDIYTSAMQIGGQAARDLRAVDRWYRRNMNMIDTALEQFDAAGGAQAYRRMIDLASTGGRQNSLQLEQALRVLPRDVRRSLSATVIDELGHPSFGSPNVLEAGAFSVDRFVTNYARLTPAGRRALFGEELGARLDVLARVAGHQKGVEAMANRSRSGIGAQNFGTGVALLNPGSTGYALIGLAGMAVTGEMLTNPMFVRWLTSASKTPGKGGLRSQVAGLAALAARDPALAPLAVELSQRAPVSNDNRPGRPPQRAAGSR